LELVDQLLTLARELIELHGGTIRAENRPGGGARFTIALKSAQAEGATVGNAHGLTAPASRDEPAPPASQPATV
jgi:hypothetical protein